MQDIATKSIHINTGADEFVASFLPGRISSLTLLVLMSSVLTNYVSVHECLSGYRASSLYHLSVVSGICKLSQNKEKNSEIGYFQFNIFPGHDYNKFF